MRPTLARALAALDYYLRPPGPDTSLSPTPGDDFLRIPEPDLYTGEGEPGYPFPPSILAGAGDDILYGAAFQGAGFGQAGDDVLIAPQRGDDFELETILNGGPGDDVFFSGTIEGWMQGGPGSDVYHLLPAATGRFAGEVVASIWDDVPYYYVPPSVQAAEEADPGFDVVVLHAPWSSFAFGVERVVATEAAGAVTLEDRWSQDVELIGNSADNMLIGRGGQDSMTGRGGADLFFVTRGASQSVSAPDITITDFARGDGLVFEEALFDPSLEDPELIDYYDDPIADAPYFFTPNRDAVREIPREVLQDILRDGTATYDCAAGIVTVDGDLDGVADATVRLEPGTALTIDDVFFI